MFLHEKHLHVHNCYEISTLVMLYEDKICVFCSIHMIIYVQLTGQF